MLDNNLTNSEKLKKIGERLKKMRKSKNITQSVVADSCGLTRSTWSRMESGKLPIGMELVLKICNYFKVSPNYLLNYEENETQIKDSIEKIVEYYQIIGIILDKLMINL